MHLGTGDIWSISCSLLQPKDVLFVEINGKVAKELTGNLIFNCLSD